MNCMSLQVSGKCRIVTFIMSARFVLFLFLVKLLLLHLLMSYS